MFNKSVLLVCFVFGLNEPLPSINKVYSLALKEEQQFEIFIVYVCAYETHAFTVKVDGGRPTRRSMAKKERPILQTLWNDRSCC